MSIPNARMVETRRESGAWKAKHARILAAALDEFIDRGFNGASMDRIAAKAKVSKVTIYNHFENKDLLYRQMIDYYVSQVHPGVPPIEQVFDVAPRDILTRYGVALVEVTASNRSIGMIRLLRSDPQLFLEASRVHGEAKLLPDGKALAGYLNWELKNDRMRVPNVDVAARQFIGMLLENTVYPSLMGMPVELSRKNVQDIVESCVATFLSYYGHAG